MSAYMALDRIDGDAEGIGDLGRLFPFDTHIVDGCDYSFTHNIVPFCRSRRLMITAESAGVQSWRSLPSLSLLFLALLDLEDFDRIRTDESSVNELIAHVSDLMVHREQFVECSEIDGTAFHDPVKTEVTESDRFLTVIGIRHIVADVHRLAENGIIGMVPEVVAVIVLVHVVLHGEDIHETVEG